MDTFKNQVIQEYSDLLTFLEDHIAERRDFTEKVQKRFDKIEKEYIHFKDADSWSIQLSECINELDGQLWRQRAQLDSALLLIKEELQSVRDDLSETIPSLDEIKNSILEHLKPIQIDFNKLAKEIDVLKKSIKHSKKK